MNKKSLRVCPLIKTMVFLLSTLNLVFSVLIDLDFFRKSHFLSILNLFLKKWREFFKIRFRIMEKIHFFFPILNLFLKK